MRLPGLALLVSVLACAAVLGAPGSAHAEPAYLSDCGQGLPPEACGQPAARWDTATVQFCAYQASRPAWLSELQFRGALADAVATWNALGASVQARLIGDCTAPWLDADGRNTVAFDDARAVVGPRQLGITRPRISISSAQNPTTRRIEEADIILSPVRPAGDVQQCFRAVLTHELGHALGLGHSEDPLDLMFPTLDPAGPCSVVPSASERAKLQSLYAAASQPAGAPEAALTAPVTRRLPGSGFALFVFSGGTGTQLLAASGCPAATAAFWATSARGEFVTYVPGARIALVNAEWEAMFPRGIPADTALLGRCS